MLSTLVFILTIFFCNVHSFEDNYGLDKKLFHAFLDEIYGTNFRMDSFIDIMWPKISELIPESVTLPGVEILSVGDEYLMTSNNEYMCATDTTIWAQVGKILNKKLVNQTKKKVTFEVEAELLLDAKPIMFEVTKKSVSNKASPAVPVSCVFKGPNKVKILLEIPNFLRERAVLIPKCMVKVKNVLVVELSDPTFTSDTTDESLKQVERDYWRGLDSQMDVVLTVGLVKAVNDQLSSKVNSWMCSSEFFKNVVSGYKREWAYSEKYFKYCPKGSRND